MWAAFVLLVTGLLLWLHLHEVPAERACHSFFAYSPMGGHLPSCGYSAFTDANNLFNLLGEALGFSCVAVAAWAGGALLGRELESGTAELAWTQSVSPARWLAAKLTTAAVPVAAGGALLALLFGWAWSSDRDSLVSNWTYDRVFIPRGPLLPALLLLGLAVGALAGIALRRTLPALGAAAAVTLVVRLYLRKAWTPLHGPLHGFWPVQLLATAMVLALAAAATVGAFCLLRRRAR
ncbi:hypothetical protein GCM10011578_059270 [Streptomyces fuscichromogenes]|uniref:ABC transporter permease n=1 Tax=Streptomyces fuscichromogenes TaxID=1324013 RepID=A0A917XI18_9ACTN|nr:hypothetical protein GCM10011578_059270 [Streptomyces fuscichromogenes]